MDEHGADESVAERERRHEIERGILEVLQTLERSQAPGEADNLEAVALIYNVAAPHLERAQALKVEHAGLLESAHLLITRGPRNGRTYDTASIKSILHQFIGALENAGRPVIDGRQWTGDPNAPESTRG